MLVTPNDGRAVRAGWPIFLAGLGVALGSLLFRSLPQVTMAAGPSTTTQATHAPRAELTAADRSGFEVSVVFPGASAACSAVAGAARTATSADSARSSSSAESAGLDSNWGYGWLVGVPGGTDDESGARIAWAASESSVVRTIGGCESVGKQPTVEARLEPVGRLRGHDVARLRVRFAGYTSTGAQVFHERVTVRVDFVRTVDFATPIASAARNPASGTFDLVLGSLLNGGRLPPVTAPVATAGATESFASDPDALKLIVNADGPVSIRGSDLEAAGWDLSRVPAGSISLRTGGVDVAVLVSADGPYISAEDTIQFEGRAARGRYTRENVYWLTRDGGRTRIGTEMAAPVSAQRATSFMETVHLEEDTTYLISLLRGESDDRWFWGTDLSPSHPVFSTTVQLPNLAVAASGAKLTVHVLGFAHDRRVAPDHRFQVDVNGSSVGVAEFDGPGAQLIDLPLGTRTLRTGKNVIALRRMDSGTEIDRVFVNWIEIAYPATYRAENDSASVGSPGSGTYTFEIGGFSIPDPILLDVTAPDVPVSLTGADGFADGAGYGLRFTYPVTGGTRLRAFGPDVSSPPARIEVNSPSDWRRPRHGADYIVITHRDFADAVRPLAARHAADGLRVVTVLVEDIYDEFSAGRFDPRAIKSFIDYAYHSWAGAAPTYVLLVGEANLDYRRGYNSGPPNFVPSLQFDTVSGLTGEMGEATSDLLYATVDGDDLLPDVLLGRISVGTANQAATVVSKTLRFMDEPQSAEWKRRVVLVADDDGAEEFEPFSEALAAALPPDGEASRFYAATYPRERNLPADISDAVESGALAFNFTGHGNVTLWSPWPGGPRIFQNRDIAELTNGERMPIFTSATCMNGWFDHPLSPVSMSEVWLTNPHGGGVVAWTPSGMAPLTPAQRTMLPAVYRGLFDGRMAPIGVLTAQGIAEAIGASGDWSDVIRMFVLFGDPALVVSGANRSAVTPLWLPRLHK